MSNLETVKSKFIKAIITKAKPKKIYTIAFNKIGSNVITHLFVSLSPDAQAISEALKGAGFEIENLPLVEKDFNK